MDLGLKDHLLNDARAWDKENKAAALQLLKNNPEYMKLVINDQIENWLLQYVMSTGNTAFFNGRTDIDELMEAYRELFKEELAAMA